MAVVVVITFSTVLGLVSGDIVLQNSELCSPCSHEYCRNPPAYKTEYSFQSRDIEDIRSQTYQYYQDSQNCIVNIRGKPQHQLEILIEQMDLDAYINPEIKVCNDFVKLFNGPKVDNARLLPGIPPYGLCGTIQSAGDMPDQRSFKTTLNELTVQFKTDRLKDNKGGFRIQIRQYPYSNPSNLYPDGGNPGGWNDGSYNEFQTSWDSQAVIPGGINPGGGNDYDKDPNGVTCYTCSYCQVEPFDAEDSGTGTDDGCHVCSKEWDNEYQVARRACYSQTDYNNLLRSISTTSTVSEYIGCKQFVNYYQRTVNYCFCKDNYCNSSRSLLYSPVVLVQCLILWIFLRKLNIIHQ